MKRMLAITCAGALLLALTSCSALRGAVSSITGSKSNSGSSVSSSAGSVGSSSFAGSYGSAGSSSSEGSGDEGDVSASSQSDRSPLLYIGMNGDFQVFPLEQKGEVTYQSLVQGIADLTGWNLDLESAVEGNGKIVISFADTCALYAGPPQEQKEEFRVLDAGQLDQTILDSIHRTIQKWVGTEDGEAEVAD